MPYRLFFLRFHDYISGQGPSIWSRDGGLQASACRFKKLRKLESRPYTMRPSQREPRHPQTHYEIFPATLPSGPPPAGSFDVDLQKLRKEFLQLQAKAHPDMHHGQDKSRAEGLSMRINEAYKTLQSPLLRAQYLLSLRGIDLAEDETAKVEDADLLMDVLEIREAIESAQEETELAPLNEENDAKIQNSLKVLNAAFAANDIKSAAAEAVRLRYWNNIKESLDAWEKGKEQPPLVH